ncbi:MAG: hypothetical protein WAM60_13680, partial [Candidatus Promineifilaceae bacterium]
MSDNLLQTKLYVPQLRPSLVPRPNLIQKLNQGVLQGGKLTLISAPAGFGKTTLITDWITHSKRPTSWLSLDEEDCDPTRFLTYLIAAVQRIAPEIGIAALAGLQSPQPLPLQVILTPLLNEIAALPGPFTLVLDDYHVIDAQPIDQALTFLLDHLPPQMHLVITTREDPNFPLARLRVRGQLTELRAADLRFTFDEAVTFFREGMGLALSEDDIAALEARTEGWISGLQLAALAIQTSVQGDTASFIQSFTGSHRFVLDYLVEEVLHRQTATVQTFLLTTSILDRFCAPLCEAVLNDPAVSAQEILAYLEQANLFIVPLDNERRWYRYHHLFGDLLRRRLHQSGEAAIATIHKRASDWLEENGLDVEAFHHAAAANDIVRAERLIAGRGMPLHYRGVMVPVLNWLDSLPTADLEASPFLLVTYASVLTMTGKPAQEIRKILQSAEAVLQTAEPDDRTNDLIGQIAAIRAMLGIPQNQLETIITQSRRALDFLSPDNLPVRTTTTWTLGYAYQIKGDRSAAIQTYREAIINSEASGNVMMTLAATTCLGQLQEAENQLHQAADSYRRVLKLVGDPPWPSACEAILGLARIEYQWNDLETAERHANQSLQLAQQLSNVDTPAAVGLLLARLKLAKGEDAGAVARLSEVEQFASAHHFDQWLNEITAVRIQILLRQGNLAAADQLAQAHDLRVSQARVHLVQGDPSAALAVLEPVRQQAEARRWADERLKVMILQAIAYQAQGETEKAAAVLGELLMLAEPGGIIRRFVDEGPQMAVLLKEAARHNIAP